MQAREVLDAMRAEHERNDCGFFAFTMIRPPLDWIVSLYDDICHRRLRGHKDTCPQQVSGALSRRGEERRRDEGYYCTIGGCPWCWVIPSVVALLLLLGRG